MALAPTSEDMKDPPVKDTEPDEDLEDGEIEDDDDEEVPPPPEPGPTLTVTVEAQPPRAGGRISPPREKHKERSEEKERIALGTPPEGTKHKKKHLTEAEKSVMRLHKLERLEREKREKYRREQTDVIPVHAVEPIDDYAVSLEKALAKVLRKDGKTSDEDKQEEEVAKRGKKRKRKDKHKKAKKNKQESPKNPEDEIERRSPEAMEHHLHFEDESSDSESSSDKGDMRKRHNNRMDKRAENKNRQRHRDRSRERNDNNRPSFKKLRKRNVGICLYYLQGKCNDDHCQYSHDCVQPLKLELCKFYLLDCCAKGDKCLYMHSDFPCKYFHTGIPCPYADDCKFAHGGPLPESVKQILFKHIETAPKEILGNFPRLSRENAHMMITQAQKNLEMRKTKEKEETNNPVATNKEDKFDKFYEDIKFDEMNPNKNNDQNHDKKEKRNRRSRWQDPEPDSPMQQLQQLHQQQKQQQQQQQQQQSQGMNLFSGFGMNSVGFGDQDMRIDSNGDVDMRTTPMVPQSIHPTDIANPNIFTSKPPPILTSNLNSGLDLLQLHQSGNFGSGSGLNILGAGTLNPFIPPPALDIEQYKMDAAAGKEKQVSLSDMESKDIDFRLPPKDIDLRMDHLRPPADIAYRLKLPAVDTDMRQPQHSELTPDEEENENALQIDIQEEPKSEQETETNLPSLPRVQRDLFARIQSQQKLNAPVTQSKPGVEEPDQNIDWYSDDEDDDNKLTIEHEDEEDVAQDKVPVAKQDQIKSDSPAEPAEHHAGVDLSKISISAEVSKLLSTIQQSTKADPRVANPERERKDPRLLRINSAEEKVESITIYQQHSHADSNSSELRKSDVDLRDLAMPFKSMANYTPATEIDGSFNNHPVMTWKVAVVEIPKPDYTGLRLSASDAQTSGDPRLRKIFRLSTEEKDSPASPSGSPEHKPNPAPVPRVDPRRKKAMEQQDSQVKDPGLTQPLTYAQQLTTLQSSPFYQSLTSKQKLMLNQELASRNDQSGMLDPIISAMLSNLGLQAATLQTQHTPQQTGQALNIINNLTGLAPQNPLLGVSVSAASMLGAAPPNLGQGLLGPAPGHLQDFQMNFDPRNGAAAAAAAALLSSAPNVVNFQGDFPQAGGGNYQEEFFDNNYQQPLNNPQPQQRGNNHRDRNNRRGRNNNNNNRNRNFFRHNNRNNRNRNSPS